MPFGAHCSVVEPVVRFCRSVALRERRLGCAVVAGRVLADERRLWTQDAELVALGVSEHSP
jgi:hypothetical protein